MFSCTFASFKAPCDKEVKHLVEDVVMFLLKEPCLFSENVIASRHDRFNHASTVDFMFYKNILYSRVSQVGSTTR